MGMWKKIGLAAMDILFPENTSKALRVKWRRTKRAFTSNRVLKCFWLLIGIVVSPILLAFSLFAALLKTIVIWILPEKQYVQTRFLFNQFIDDIIKRHINLKVALKRVSLCYEMFTKGAERKVSFGEKNPEKTFYVLRPYYYLKRNELTQNVSNLLVHYYRNLQNLAYAIENNWIPVVDWQNYGPFSHGENYPILGTTNCWEYYWNQPSEYTLEEVYESKNVILSDRNTKDNAYVPSCFFREPLQKQAEDYAIRCPKYDQYITLNDYTEKYIREKQEELFPKGSRILGVSVRGTSYGVSSTMVGFAAADAHPKQPKIFELIDRIINAIEKWKMDYVFITCESQNVIDEIRKALNDKVIFLPRERYTRSPQRGDVEKGLDPLYLPGHKYQTNLDYLTEMMLLSRCTALLASMSSGTRSAIIWNRNQYEHMEIIDNGLW